MSSKLICLSQCSRGKPLRSRRLFVSKDRLPNELTLLRNKPGAHECLILTTCLRFEIYAVVATGRDYLRPLKKYLEESHDVRDLATIDSVTVREGDDAVKHLFSVVSGLDSHIIGERQIVSQIKNAYHAALRSKCTEAILNRLFQRSLNVSKRVRRKSRIEEGVSSAASHAVKLIRERHGSLTGKRALILGAGQMGKLVGLHLNGSGCKDICFCSRSMKNSRVVAEQCSASHEPYAKFFEMLEGADILVTATGAPHEIVGFRNMQAAMDKRNGRGLCVLDLADPPDVDPRVALIEGISHYSIQCVDALAAKTRKKRAAAAAEAQLLVEKAVTDFNLSRLMHAAPATTLKPRDCTDSHEIVTSNHGCTRINTANCTQTNADERG
ncbi:MAG: glutamyl-tRNA reductase [bacterium]